MNDDMLDELMNNLPPTFLGTQTLQNSDSYPKAITRAIDEGNRRRATSGNGLKQ
jgi:hypothetical protein